MHVKNQRIFRVILFTTLTMTSGITACRSVELISLRETRHPMGAPAPAEAAGRSSTVPVAPAPERAMQLTPAARAVALKATGGGSSDGTSGSRGSRSVALPAQTRAGRPGGAAGDATAGGQPFDGRVGAIADSSREGGAAGSSTTGGSSEGGARGGSWRFPSVSRNLGS